MPEQTSPVRRTLRRLGVGSGPLTRGSDRVEVASRVLSVLVLILALPTALTVGAFISADTGVQAQDQAATRHRQVAVLLADAADADRGDIGTLTVATPGTWRAPDGTAHEGMVRAPHGAASGDHVTIWVDEAGDQTERPLETVDVVTGGLLAGVFTFLGIAGLTAAGHVGVRRALEGHRARQWEREWRSVEPQWAERR